MKNLLFSALACVAFAGSSFASNEIVSNLNKNGELTSDVKVTEISKNNLETNSKEDFIPCSVQIEYTYNGKTFVKSAYADVANGDGCADFSNTVKSDLISKGFRIDGSIAISGVYLTKF